jgi:hypothetical protein
MSKAYEIVTGVDEFSAAREHYGFMVEHLQSEEGARLEHGGVEEFLSREGTELLRRLLQGHLELRARREKPLESVMGCDGVERRQVREGCERGLMTLFGEVVVRRKGYGRRGESSLYPLDAELNLPEDRYSHGLRLRVSEAVSGSSFDEAVEQVQRTTGGKVAKRQALALARDVSRDFEAFYAGGGGGAAEPTSDPLVMSVDGKGVVMRPEGLREATRRAGERSSHKLETRLSKGEKRHRKRMATVATLYSVAAHPRTPEQIMGLEERGEAAPRPRDKRVWASLEREPSQIIEEQFREALRRDPQRRREWVVLVDGNATQLGLIATTAKRYGAPVTIILDFIHVLEYLWKATYCFHPEGSEQAERWVGERALRVLQGKSSEVAAGMRRSATLQGLAGEERAALDTCAGYLLKYRKLLRYDEYLERGLPIATGVVEGACRHLVKDRMDLTGARWGLPGAEAVLKLRSLHCSHDFEEYWELYKVRALERNHASRYPDCSLRRAA